MFEERFMSQDITASDDKVQHIYRLKAAAKWYPPLFTEILHVCLQLNLVLPDTNM